MTPAHRLDRSARPDRSAVPAPQPARPARGRLPPFPTKLVADALHKTSSERVYVTMYGLTLLTIRLLGSALDAYARHEHLYPRQKRARSCTQTSGNSCRSSSGRSRPSCAGTWSGSPSRETTAWCSSVRRVAGCGGLPSGGPGQSPHRRGAARPAFSRFAAHWNHDGGGPGRKPPGADGANGALQRPGRTHLLQHATQERDEAIAAGMGKLLRQARRKARTAAGGASTESPSGTQRPRGRKRASQRSLRNG